MFVVHAHWHDGTVHLWAESRALYAGIVPASDHGLGAVGSTAPAGITAVAVAQVLHPFTASSAALAKALGESQLLDPDLLASHGTMQLRLPAAGDVPQPSDRLSALTGAIPHGTHAHLDTFDVQTIVLPAAKAMECLLRIEARASDQGVHAGHSLAYWCAVARFALEMLVDQRFVPTLMQPQGGALEAAWQPWLADETAQKWLHGLLSSMPAVCRAVVNGDGRSAWPIVDEALRTMIDTAVRHTLIREEFFDAIEDRSGQEDAHIAWLGGLLNRAFDVEAPEGGSSALMSNVRQWMARLDDVEPGRTFRLMFDLVEPAIGPDEGMAPDDPSWRLSLHLCAAEENTVRAAAEQVWSHSPDMLVIRGRRIDQPQELLLREMGRAARLYPQLEEALAEATPTGIDLTTHQAYLFLSEFRPVLEESGFVCNAPSWWDDPSQRLGVRMRVESEQLDLGPGGGPVAGAGMMGLDTIVSCKWQVAIGDQTLTAEQFQELANQRTPLVWVGGRWVAVDPAEIDAASKFVDSEEMADMPLREAVRLAHGISGTESPLPVLGMDATGWVARLLEATGTDAGLPDIPQPKRFLGELRRYQLTGLRWLVFLDRLGFGACLADDMGLGKTIQLIALLIAERDILGDNPGPTLLVVPTSVLGNWQRELDRFAPHLRQHVHHGPERATGAAFHRIATESDVIITTYALVSRDTEMVQGVEWRRVVLDEAQYIKNPPTKQAMAIRALPTERRVALTGTPVENRLSELWSIMDFCNPGYLGPQSEFRRRFAVPIERRRDQHKARQLREFVRPFILRRLKTDPKVIDDLPACVETKEFATLTGEQVTAYRMLVGRMLNDVDRSEGIQRRGLVLATLVKLKQVCNHPALLKKGADHPPEPEHTGPLSARSGKSRRLIQLLEEVLAEGDSALIFTQFRQMGFLLSAMIQADLNREAIFLHGGTPQPKRQDMIDRFQTRDGTTPIFILSLKAGGLGLNLTAANHVFHYDRWWNPAVENQATDRAFRIGQTRTVHVHKFVCMGTLEERIDQMIEQKKALADNIIGAGEDWLTELSTSQLKDVLTLRQTALEEEDA